MSSDNGFEGEKITPWRGTPFESEYAMLSEGIARERRERDEALHRLAEVVAVLRQLDSTFKKCRICQDHHADWCIVGTVLRENAP